VKLDKDGSDEEEEEELRQKFPRNEIRHSNYGFFSDMMEKSN